MLRGGARAPRGLEPARSTGSTDLALRRPLATWFVADWRDMLFVHYRVPAAVLQPEVPHPLDLRDGDAWVSLVFFRLERMRPPGTGVLGRALLRPISDHLFLNVRTYVRAEGGPGIHFLAEWIPNRLSAWIGPRAYGLPYRLGRFDCDLTGGANGIGRIEINDPEIAAGFRLTLPTRNAAPTTACPGGIEYFLLERYTAYTCREGVRRCFRVAHERWRFHAVDWVRTDTTLLERAFPWFAAARLHSAHRTPGVRDVRMSRPATLNPGAT